MLTKKVVFYGNNVCLACDGKCSKAWGRNGRKKEIEGDYYYYLADSELGAAPIDPGTYEGSDGKPIITISSDMNRWCARECERCVIVDEGEQINLPSFEMRLKAYEVFKD